MTLKPTVKEIGYAVHLRPSEMDLVIPFIVSDARRLYRVRRYSLIKIVGFVH